LVCGGPYWAAIFKYRVDHGDVADFFSSTGRKSNLSNADTLIERKFIARKRIVKTAHFYASH